MKLNLGIAVIALLATALHAESGNSTTPPQTQPGLPSRETVGEARLRFARERQFIPSHGLYQDFVCKKESDSGWVIKPVSSKDEATASVKITNNPAQDNLLSASNLNSCPINPKDRVIHCLARDLSAPSLNEAITNNRGYIADDHLCDTTNFSFGAINNLGVFNIGDTALMIGKTRLVALSPVAAILRLFHEDKLVQETTAATNLIFDAKDDGSYRLEAWLTVDGKEVPWICTSPIHLRPGTLADVRLPSMAISPEVEVTRNISYCEGAERDIAKHQLDLYVPRGKTNSPVLFFIHGGAWKSGDRSQYPPLGNRYARAGYVTVIPSYRLAPKNKHPAQIEDVAAAFAWTVQHIGEHGGYTNRIYVAGHSAGGHLAALLALDQHYLVPYHLSPANIHGVLALSGVYDLMIGDFQESVFGKSAAERRAASPLFQVKAGAPPFLVEYCQWDYFTLPWQAREFHRTLQGAGVKSDLLYVASESHISEMLSFAREDDPFTLAALKFMQ